MWPVLGMLFWVLWVSVVAWQWFADWLTHRYLSQHDRARPEPVVVLGKRLYDGPDGLHYYGTFKAPGALPMEWELSSATYSVIQRGDHGIALVSADGAATFQKAA